MSGAGWFVGGAAGRGRNQRRLPAVQVSASGRSFCMFSPEGAEGPGLADAIWCADRHSGAVIVGVW